MLEACLPPSIWHFPLQSVLQEGFFFHCFPSRGHFSIHCIPSLSQKRFSQNLGPGGPRLRPPSLLSLCPHALLCSRQRMFPSATGLGLPPADPEPTRAEPGLKHGGCSGRGLQGKDRHVPGFTQGTGMQTTARPRMHKRGSPTCTRQRPDPQISDRRLG